MAKELGLSHLAMPTNGNAGAAMAAYASRAGLCTTIFCPEDTPEVNVSEIALQGAEVYRVNGLINDCGKVVGDGKETAGWFDVSTLKEPYRIEGKKTMGLELAEQFGWELPDVIFYPTGGGTGLIGMWKAFDELEAIGWIGSKRPRMVAVQAEGARYRQGLRRRRGTRTPLGERPQRRRWHSCACGRRGFSDSSRRAGKRRLRHRCFRRGHFRRAGKGGSQEEGLYRGPEGAATFAAYEQALAAGQISPSERTVLFNCATGWKYPMPTVHRALDRHHPIDYAAFA